MRSLADQATLVGANLHCSTESGLAEGPSAVSPGPLRPFGQHVDIGCRLHYDTWQSVLETAKYVAASSGTAHS